MKRPIIPVMFCFFAMGFVDLVGIASNYVKYDLGLSDTMANLLPSLVFLWFLVFSIPTSLLMNRIGRKRTVLLSLLITAVSLMVPLFTKTFAAWMVAFSLLGIGNTLMQTSLNPLVASVMKGKNVAGTLSFGQFVKAIASFMAPYIAIWGATEVIPSGALGWKVLFLIYLIIGLLAALLLLTVHIDEEPTADSSSFAGALRLLSNPTVLLCFIAIICTVGVDVGTNTTAPKIMMERLGISLDVAAKATSLYFICRTLGCFVGGWLLRVMKDSRFLFISAAMMVIAVVLFIIGQNAWMLYTAVILMGLGNSNPFSIIFARAMAAVPSKQNEASGLMIMGIIGGAIFPPIMGAVSDATSQTGAVLVMALGILYLLFLVFAFTRPSKR